MSCEDSNNRDTSPPTISIQSPTANEPINEITTIIARANDNKGIDKVEFYINDSLFSPDSEPPYEYEWNTTIYEDNSEHTIILICYDNSGNFTTSQTLILSVDNSASTPNGGDIISVTYTLTEMMIEWEPSTDEDFKNYKVMYAETEVGNRDTLETLTERSTTTYKITDFDPSVDNWFWIQVTDTLGLRGIGTGKTNVIDRPPTLPILKPIVFENNSFIIRWSQNNNYDFKSYTLYESESLDMSNKIEVHVTEEVSDSSVFYLQYL